IVHGFAGGSICCSDDDSSAIGRLLVRIADRRFAFAHYRYARGHFAVGCDGAGEDARLELLGDGSHMVTDLFTAGFIRALVYLYFNAAARPGQKKTMSYFGLVESHGHIAAFVHLFHVLFV